MRGVWVCGLLSLFGGGIAGYHPYAEDGGVYAAGIKKLLHPQLYPAYTAFVTEHLRFSLYAPLVAALTRASHLPLEWVLLILYGAALWTTLFAAWGLAARFNPSPAGQVGAVALLACWLTLPIAGTSLMLMDPYVTARSLVLPLCLGAMALTLDFNGNQVVRWTLVALLLGFAACLHPLMAGYGVAAVLAIVAVRQGWAAMTILTAATFLLSAGLQTLAPPESAEYLQAELTRYYWFLSRWKWFEGAGLGAPLVLIFWLGQRRDHAARLLSRSMLLLGILGLAVALAFCRENLKTHLVARLQPLRCFQLVYIVMILLLGTWLGERVRRGRAWVSVTALLCLGGVMLFAQRQIYAHSAAFEWPGEEPVNAWEQAFLWVHTHTPEDAVFALDARYVTSGRGEDAQCFRALAERSALPDYSKDGGEAAITPELAGNWARGERAAEHLEAEDDTSRQNNLRGTGADWIVLDARSTTRWLCPYRNQIVKVCRIPQ